MEEGRKVRREGRRVKKHILLENLHLKVPENLPGSPTFPDTSTGINPQISEVAPIPSHLIVSSEEDI